MHNSTLCNSVKMMPPELARWLYSLLFYLALPAVLLRLWWRGRKAPGYRDNWQQRLGFVAPLSRRPLWIHAVSVGETVAIAPLVTLLQARCPNLPILITNATPTGAERTRGLFGSSVMQLYCPYDLPCVLRRFLTRIQPLGCVVVETELWPNMLAACYRHRIPVVLANARLSEKSARGYDRVASLTQQMLVHLTCVVAQSDADARRFVQLGLAADKVQVAGNIKFDITLSPQAVARGQALKQQWPQCPVIILASSHADEEARFLQAFWPLRAQLSGLLLVVVPRHPERFDAAYAVCQAYSPATARHSQPDVSADAEIYLGDTMGDLISLYALSDCVVMGGSFVPVGGHNPLEPALLGKPVIMGPHSFNFAQITAQMNQQGAMVQVEDMPAAAQVALALCQQSERRQQMGAQAERYALSQRGAVEKLYQVIKTQVLPDG